MKLDFDPRKNVTKLDYFIMHISRVNFKQRIHYFSVTRKIIRNWVEVIFFRLGLKKNITIIFKSGLVKHFNSDREYFDFFNTRYGQRELLNTTNLKDVIKITKKYIIFTWHSKKIKLAYDTSKQLVDTIGLIRGVFFEEDYKWLEVKGKDVIDIGANIGDTAIYFALKGARHVYAFEPYPYSYGLAQKNIKANRLNNKITIINEGCGGKSSYIRINPNYRNTKGSDLRQYIEGKKIKIVTLNEIIKRFHIDNAILKVDCEGCEYAFLLNAKKKLFENFEQIMIEYHYGYINLKNKLKKQYSVMISKPNLIFNSDAENIKMLSGIIKAKIG